MNLPSKSILIIGAFLSQHIGYTAVCEEVATNLPKRGWTVYTTSAKRSRIARLVDIVATIWKYRKQFQLAQVDIFSGFAFVWAEIAIFLLTILNKPFILTLHGGGLPDFSQRWPRRVKRVLQHASAVTAPSRYLQEQMRIYRQDIQLLPNPLYLENYPFRLRHTPYPKLVWLRSFHHIYNPKLAILVLKELITDFPSASLIMIGPDKGDGSLEVTKQMAKDLKMEEHLTITGGVEKQDVPQWLERADIFLNTTTVDNTPVSVLEAMACGLCIVSTDVGGLNYLLEHESDALLVPSNDALTMAASVKRILRDPNLAHCISRNARMKSEAMNWDVILPQWDSLLQQVLLSSNK